MLVEGGVVVSLIGLAGGLMLPEGLARSSKTTALMAAARRRQHLWLLACAVFCLVVTAFASLNVLAGGLGGRDAAFALARVAFSAAIALVIWSRLDASRLALPLVFMLLLSHSLSSLAESLPTEGNVVLEELPGILRNQVLLSFLLMAPLMLVVGTLETFRIVGPLHRIER